MKHPLPGKNSGEEGCVLDNRIKRRDTKGFSKSRFTAFLDKQGIYLVMLACLAIIGIAAYFTLGGNLQAQGPTPAPSQKQANAVLTPLPTGTTSPAATSAGTPTSTAKPVIAQGQKAVLPVKGEILRAFSPTDPVYYATINAWMIHTGVDISCSEGSSVKASLDGTVESVKNDPATGYTIVIKSSGNVQTVYGNLSAPQNIKVGQAVKQGDTIGTVGRSEQDVIGDPPHLHFAYLISGKFKDPWQPASKPIGAPSYKCRQNPLCKEGFLHYDSTRTLGCSKEYRRNGDGYPAHHDDPWDYRLFLEPQSR
jgi:murein DD-endopeptidase MepM/ murein hydrolase activator NlpD